MLEKQVHWVIAMEREKAKDSSLGSIFSAEFVGPSGSQYPDGGRAYKGFDSTTGRDFAFGITRANSSRVPAHCSEKRRLTGPSGKGGSNFSKQAIIDSCGPRDRDGCKKRIETSATFQEYERHAKNPIGSPRFSLSLYLTLSVTILLSVSPFLLNISAAQGPPRTTLVVWRNIQYTRYIGHTKAKGRDSAAQSSKRCCSERIPDTLQFLER